MQKREFVPKAGKKRQKSEKKAHQDVKTSVEVVREEPAPKTAESDAPMLDIHVQKQQEEEEKKRLVRQEQGHVKTKKLSKSHFEMADAPVIVNSSSDRPDRKNKKSKDIENVGHVREFVPSAKADGSRKSGKKGRNVERSKYTSIIENDPIQSEEEEEEDKDEEEMSKARHDNDHITNFQNHCVPISLFAPVPTEAKPFTQSIPLKEALEKKDTTQQSDLFLFQLPSILPMNLVTSEVEIAGGDNRFSACTLAQCGSGRIGTLQIRKSGKTELVLGKCGSNSQKEFVMDVSPGCEFNCFQEIMSFKAQHTSDLEEVYSTCTVVGEIQPNNFYVCSYLPTELL